MPHILRSDCPAIAECLEKASQSTGEEKRRIVWLILKFMSKFWAIC